MGLKNISSGGEDFEIHPVGSYAARLVRIIELGTQSSTYMGQTKKTRKVLLAWESEHLMTEGDNAGKPYLIMQRLTLSMAPKATLRKFIESWRGKKFTEDEVKGYDLTKLAGRAAQLSIVHEESGDGKTYANIMAISMLRKGVNAPAQVNPSLVFDIDNPDMDVFKQLSERVQGLIVASPEWQERGKSKEPPMSDADGPTSGTGREGPDFEDDDIPF